MDILSIRAHQIHAVYQAHMDVIKAAPGSSVAKAAAVAEAVINYHRALARLRIEERNMSQKPDWATAPAGATHYGLASGSFYRNINPTSWQVLGPYGVAANVEHPSEPVVSRATPQQMGRAYRHKAPVMVLDYARPAPDLDAAIEQTVQLLGCHGSDLSSIPDKILSRHLLRLTEERERRLGIARGKDNHSA